MMNYSNRQKLTTRQGIIYMIVPAVLIVASYWLKFRDMDNAATVIMITNIIIIIWGWLLSTLDVIVDNNSVKARFKAGVIHMTVPISEIVSVKIFKYSWGDAFLRSANITRSGRMINLMGKDAIELELKDGSYRRIGTNDAENLSQAIGRVLQPS